MSNSVKNTVLTIILFTILACNNDDDTSAGQAVLQNDTSNTTGQLIVEIIDVNNNPVNGVYVKLYTSYEDLENDIALYEFFNSSQGDVDFGYLNVGDYYIYAKENGGARRDNGKGTVAQVRSQKTTITEVIIQ